MGVPREGDWSSGVPKIPKQTLRAAQGGRSVGEECRGRGVGEDPLEIDDDEGDIPKRRDIAIARAAELRKSRRHDHPFAEVWVALNWPRA